MEARKGQDLRQQGLMHSTTARPAMYGRGRTGFEDVWVRLYGTGTQNM